MNTYIVEYTDETMVSNQCYQMEINARTIELAYEHINIFYPNLAINQIYLA